MKKSISTTVLTSTRSTSRPALPFVANLSRIVSAQTGSVLLLLLVGSLLSSAAKAGPADPSIFEILAKWTPLIAYGFIINIWLSLTSMFLGTILGVFVGVCRSSSVWMVRKGSWLLTQFFRNAPWLILLFYCVLLIPFQIEVGGAVVPFPGWVKAMLALSLGVMANMAEIVRGAIQSVPLAQWEAAEALAFSRQRTLWRIILPQCIKRMLPSWMNLYALVLVSTPLCSIVGVAEALSVTSDALVAETRSDLLLPMYAYVLLWFFIASYPLAYVTKRLERRYSSS